MYIILTLLFACHNAFSLIYRVPLRCFTYSVYGTCGKMMSIAVDELMKGSGVRDIV